MNCYTCKKEFPISDMTGKGKRYCKPCFDKLSKFMKSRKNTLIGLRSLPLEGKLYKTKMIIREAIKEFGLEHVYISYSGGKDSSVLSHIIRNDYPTIMHVFSNTTNEYPETLHHILWERDYNDMNIIITRPRDKYGKAFNFRRVVNEYGFPIFTKRVSNAIRTYRNARSVRTKQNSIDYIKRNFKKHEKYKELNISDKCCEKLKKDPLKKIAKTHGFECAIIGTLTEESRTREVDWLKNGCNIFYQKKDNQCRPLSFWTESDIYKYIKKYDVKLPKIYDMGYSRNGCMFCGFGVEYESQQGENRYEKLKKTHPKMYKYLVTNFGELLDKCEIKY